MALKCSSCGAPARRDQLECSFCQAVLPKTHAPVVVQVVMDGVRSHVKETALGLLIIGAVLLGFLLGRDSGREPLVKTTVPLPRTSDGAGRPAMTPPPPVSIPAEAKIEIVTTEAKDSLRKSARFELHARRVAGKYVFLFGEFMNTGEATLGKPSVTAIYIDKDGKELGHKKGYGEAISVAPGESAPIMILLENPPAHAEFKFEAETDGYVETRKQAEGLKVEFFPVRKTNGTWNSSGIVINGGTNRAQFVQVTAVGRNAAGKIVGLASGYVSVDAPIAPGARARWEIPMSLMAADPARMEYFVHGFVP